ncbi:hypothetical protein FHS29_004162 [Saccharothrix tamanrassetensis]|uniref:Uncharacterized protein n=1 Tax=Saccharothrix tamanrassetensis TaxID=1051531 RepID=A0A841CNB1_9PSEU|nr:hypothetical protein [Saccharothrix tamanrassetensis]MBB5957567.1 hypothetical protein [Saccharothrix tamanrassetensis]
MRTLGFVLSALVVAATAAVLAAWAQPPVASSAQPVAASDAVLGAPVVKPLGEPPTDSGPGNREW